jgi:hypothetical protein
MVRVLFGNKVQSNNPVIMRRHKMDPDIDEVIRRKDLMPIDSFTVFTLGEENHEYLLSKGFQSNLVDKRPYIYDIGKYCWGNKLLLLQYALNLFGTPILYLDWDCLPKRPISHLNDEFKPKSCISGNLMVYCCNKCYWRTEAKRTIINGGFLYIESIPVINGIIQTWHEIQNSGHTDSNDEIAIMKYLDDLNGGWIGLDKYKELYEPTGICSLNAKGYWINKDALFAHYLGTKERRFDL